MFLINPYILQASGNPLWNDLLAYYTADNTPNDALGNYNGTLVNGATYGTGIINNGFSLDGVNDYVDLGVNPQYNFGTNDFTFSVWAYWTINRAYNPIFDIGDYFGTNNSICLYANSSQKLDLWHKDSSGSYFEIGTTGTGTFVINTWNHVVVRRTSNTIDVFINNVKYNLSTTFTAPLGNATGDSKIGYNGYSNYYVGKLDEFAAFNRALSDSEVTELYNSGAGLQY